MSKALPHAHKLLLTRSSDLRRIALARHLIKELRDTNDFNGKKYYQALSDLEECIQNNDIDIDLPSMVTPVKKSPSIFIDYVSVALENYKKFKLTCEESELQNYIIERIPNDLVDLSVVSIVNADYNFAPVVQSLENEIKKNVLTIENVGPLYQLYKNLSQKRPIKTIEPELLENLFSQAEKNSEAWFDLLAMYLAADSESSYLMDIPDINLGNTDDMVNQLAERIEYFENYGALLLSYLSWENPTLKAILKQITLHPQHDKSRLNIVQVLENYSKIQSSLDVTPKDFIERLNSWSGSAKKDITADNILEHIDSHIFFEHAVQIDCGLTRHLIEAMIEKLNSLSVNEWRDELRNPESLVHRVTRHLLDANKLKAVPDNAVTIFKELLRKVATEEFDMDRETYRIFYKNTNKSKLKSTAKNIRDLFISPHTITPKQFLFFSALLFHHGALENKSADVARRILTPVAEDDDCLKLILNNDKFFISILNDAEDDAEDFKDIIRRKLESHTDEKMIHFAKAIGIELKS